MTTTQDWPRSDEESYPGPRGEARAKSRDDDQGNRGNEENADDRDRGGDDRSSGTPKGSWIVRHKLITALVALCVVAAIVGGVMWWLNASNYADTDDAFIDARPSAISAQVAAAITDVLVTDNEVVQPGQTLVRLDDRDYVAAMAQAKAQIAEAQAAIQTAQAQTVTQQAAIEQVSQQITEAQAALTYSNDEYQRAERLLTQGAGTLQQAQAARSDLTQKQAALDASQAALLQAKRQNAVIEAQRKSAEGQLEAARAQLAQAQANLSRTVIVAPFRGRVTELTAARGAYATPGQQLMLIVPMDVWVTANFRETQLARMRVGQTVTLCIDAYGRCFPGKVNSIQAGSGTAFSLLPAENATGNYVKVVQRVPVKLEFDKQPDLELGPGMSVTPSVKVQ